MSVKEDIKKLKWERWLQREFSPFMWSLFGDGIKKKYFDMLGFNGVYFKAQLAQNNYWYESPDVWDHMVKLLNVYLIDHSIFDITDRLNVFYKEKKQRILEIRKSDGDVKEQLSEIYEIFSQCVAFIWITHGLEEYYNIKLKKEVPKYVKEDIDTFILDASFPTKKNKHALMEDAFREGVDPKKIVEDFGWIKVRDNLYAEPFSVDDIRKMAKKLKPKKEHNVNIPEILKQLFLEVQELVFFRTERTDVLYEFIFLSRPLFKKVAKYYSIPYLNIKYYTIQSLISGKPKKYIGDFCMASYENDTYLGKEFILEKNDNVVDNKIKGMIAYKGDVKGKVKIVFSVSDIDKVEEGDILVTQMTFPSYISAMYKAAAFVTDEGGITCHAAIVAREMKKPCIIGTKNATSLLKDGDLVEVDADNGVVRIVE